MAAAFISNLTLKASLYLALSISLIEAVEAWSPISSRLSASSTYTSSSPDDSSSSSSPSSFVLHVDQATPLTRGTTAVPPMVSVPCSTLIQNEDLKFPTLKEVIQPPNVEKLYDWYVNVQNQPDSDPSWAVVWPTAVTLTNYLLSNPCLIKNKNVVELGCGLGLAGLTAAYSLDAKHVSLTDREPFALHCAMSTAAVHKTSTVSAAVLDWNDDDDKISNLNLRQSADIILASDVLYDKECIDAFVNICYKIASPTGTTVLVTDPKEERTPNARQLLRGALSQQQRQLQNQTQQKDVIKDNNLGIEEMPLPIPQQSGDYTSMEGKDHERRMKEETILLKFTIY